MCKASGSASAISFRICMAVATAGSFMTSDSPSVFSKVPCRQRQHSQAFLLQQSLLHATPGGAHGTELKGW